MSEIKPCPFCGSVNIQTRESSSYRWRVAFCADCDAQAGDVRVKTLTHSYAEAVKEADEVALAEWNRRGYDALAAARDAALEDAIAAIEALDLPLSEDYYGQIQVMCADAIRALKGPQK